MESLVPVSFSNTIRFDEKPKSMDDLCQSGFSNTIRFDGKPKSMDDLLRSGFSNTIRFNGKPKAMDDFQPVHNATPSDLAKRQNRWRFVQVRYHKPAPEKPANTKHLKKGPAAQRGSPFNVP